MRITAETCREYARGAGISLFVSTQIGATHTRTHIHMHTHMCAYNYVSG